MPKFATPRVIWLAVETLTYFDVAKASHAKLITIINRRLTNDRLFGDDWLNKDQLYGAFKKARSAAGLSDKKVWHSLRHSFGTFLAETQPANVIKDLMGHKSIVTSQIYIHSNPETNRTAIHGL